jgi:hypothetical protein
MRSSMNDTIVLVAILAATIIGAAIFVMSTMTMQPAYAPPTNCNGCANEFAPGQEAENPGAAEDFAPGKLAPHCIGCAEDLAPGQLKQKEVIPP